MQNAEPVLEASRPNRAACALDLEGIVAKRLDDVYEPLIDGHNRNAPVRNCRRRAARCRRFPASFPMVEAPPTEFAGHHQPNTISASPATTIAPSTQYRLQLRTHRLRPASCIPAERPVAHTGPKPRGRSSARIGISARISSSPARSGIWTTFSAGACRRTRVAAPGHAS